MSSTVEPLCVRIPPASYARRATVRSEPAGTTIVPDATPAEMGILNNNAVGMSGAVTSATNVATAVADTSARTISVPSPTGGSIRPSPQAASTKADASVQDTVLNGLRTMAISLLKGETHVMSHSVPSGGVTMVRHVRRSHLLTTC